MLVSQKHIAPTLDVVCEVKSITVRLVDSLENKNCQLKELLGGFLSFKAVRNDSRNIVPKVWNELLSCSSRYPAEVIRKVHSRANHDLQV